MIFFLHFVKGSGHKNNEYTKVFNPPTPRKIITIFQQKINKNKPKSLNIINLRLTQH